MRLFSQGAVYAYHYREFLPHHFPDSLQPTLLTAEVLNLQEYSILSKSFSLARAANAALLTGSFYASRMTGKNLHRGMPAAVSIEPTTSCNLRCPHCPSGLRSFNRPTGMLQPEMLKEVIDQLWRTVGYMTFYFQGEPYLNKALLPMVRMAADKRIFTFTSTNAHYLNREEAEATVASGLSKMIISIDGTDQDSYARYRIGGNLNKVLEGTRQMMEAKRRLKSSTPIVEWQFIAFKHNEHQLAEIQQLAKTYQIDKLSIKTAQIYDFETADEWLPQDPNLSRYTKKNNEISIRNRLLNHCWKMWHSCVITWDGRVVPCCFDKDARYEMGNIRKNDFTAIWRGQEYRAFRNLLLRSRGNIDICKNCTEGTKIWADPS